MLILPSVSCQLNIILFLSVTRCRYVNNIISDHFVEENSDSRVGKIIAILMTRKTSAVVITVI